MNEDRTGSLVRTSPLIEEGVRPRLRSRVSGSALLITVGACAAACATNDANQVTAPTVLAMNSTMAAVYSDGEDSLYQAQRPVPLPVRAPTSAEESALGKSTIYPHAPFLLDSDERLEIRFTISNIDTSDHVAELLVDPWNEFVRYKPSVLITDEDLLPDLSGYDRFILVPALSRVQGTLTSDDTNELAVDLATVMNITKNPPTDPTFDMRGFFNHVFNLQNRSNSNDPLVAPYVPAIVPGLTGFDLGLRTSEPANIAIEIEIDLTDLNGNRIIPEGESGKEIGMPSTILETPTSDGTAAND